MKRKLGLTLTVFFLGLQLSALLHLAAYSFERHDHNGQPCSIYLLSKQSKYSAVEEAFSVPRPDFIACLITFPVQPTLLHKTYTPVTPRAPPLFLPC